MSVKSSREAAPSSEFDAAVAGLRAVLAQLRDAIDRLDDGQYTQKPVGVYDSSIGGHVRHSIDHARLLLDHAAGGTVDYDRRDRDSDVERNREAALVQLASIDGRLAALHADMAFSSIKVACTVSGAGETVTSKSSFIRELVFVQSHTVHHNALIAGMLRTLGCPVDEQFGYAPSTLAFLTRR